MKKKMILLFATVISLLFTVEVSAKTITCDYGERKILFYTEHYSDSDYSHYYDSYDSKGNETREQIPNIKSIRPMNASECPAKISINRDSISFSDDSNSFGYELVASGDGSKVSCGNISGIPKKIPELTSFAYTIVQIAIPVILVVMGSMDLFKGITAQKEDEIKKGQQMFVKRLILAAIIFFVIVIVKFLISIVANNIGTSIVDCIDCFISNDCKRE